jgi:hypothetical protein
MILLRRLFVSLVGLSPLPTTTDTTIHGTLVTLGRESRKLCRQHRRQKSYIVSLLQAGKKPRRSKSNAEDVAPPSDRPLHHYLARYCIRYKMGFRFIRTLSLSFASVFKTSRNSKSDKDLTLDAVFDLKNKGKFFYNNVSLKYKVQIHQFRTRFVQFR